MVRALSVMVFIGLAACSRSDTLASDRFDCGEGIKVFSRNATHCAYIADEAPEVDDCPAVTPHRYTTVDIVICSSVDDLTPEWIRVIVDGAWPADGGIDDNSAASDATVPDGATDAVVEDGARDVSITID